MLIISADDKHGKSGSTLCRAELEFRIILASQKINLKEKKVHDNNIFFLNPCFSIQVETVFVQIHHEGDI